MMKKYIWTVIVALTAFACAEDEYNTAFIEYAGINPSGLTNSISEDAGEVTIPIIFGGNATNGAAFNVTYEVTGGVFGENYTIAGGSSASGSVTINQGKLGSDAVGYIVIKGIPDFDTENDVSLTVTLTGAERGVRVGYPFKNSYSLTIADDDCPFDFEGELDGEDGAPDGEDGLPAAVTVVKTGEGEYTFVGISFEMIAEYWAEEIQTSAPTVVKIAPGGAITIDQQYIYTTDYQGTLYDYDIVGTGQVNYCDGTITLTYDIVYSDGSGSVAEFLGVEFFTATLTPVGSD